MKIKFYVDCQKLSIKSDPYVVEGSRNYLKAHFYFSGEWCGLMKTAVFSTPDRAKTYHVLLDENECLVPHEVINDSGFLVFVFAGNLLNTNEITVPVNSSGLIVGVTPPEATPEVYTDIVNKLGTTTTAVANLKTLTEKIKTDLADEQSIRSTTDFQLETKINSVNDRVSSEKTVRQKVCDNLQDQIGSISRLSTTNKKNLVEAINELANNNFAEMLDNEINILRSEINEGFFKKASQSDNESDLNNITEAGAYCMYGGNTSLNYPDGENSGTLLALPQIDGVIQMFIPKGYNEKPNDTLYIRTINFGSDASQWTKLASSNKDISSIRTELETLKNTIGTMDSMLDEINGVTA